MLAAMLRSALRSLLNLDDPPERTALAFAISNPWTIPPIAGASWAIGRLIIGSPPVAAPQASLSVLLTAEFWRLIAAQWRQLLPFAVGSLILSTVSAAISYPLMLYTLRNYRRKYPRAASHD